MGAYFGELSFFADERPKFSAVSTKFTTVFALSKKDFVGNIIPVETNIIIFEVKGPYSPVSFCAKLKEHQILCLPISASQVRMVVHLDITHEMVNLLLSVLESL